MNLAIYMKDVSEDRPLYVYLNRIVQVYAMGGLPLPEIVFLESPLYKRVEFEVQEAESRQVKTLDQIAQEQKHPRVITMQFPSGAITIKELGGAQ